MLTAAAASGILSISGDLITFAAALLGILGGWAAKSIWTSSRAQSEIALQDSVISTLQVALDLKAKEIESLQKQMSAAEAGLAAANKRIDFLTEAATQKAAVGALTRQVTANHAELLQLISGKK